MDKLKRKIKQRLNRRIHIRKRVSGTTDRPRLCVFKSNMRLYLQVIDDTCGKTVAAASLLEKEFRSLRPNLESATKLGSVLGSRLKEKKIKKVVFDRSGYKYHGVVKAVANAVRGAGIEF